MLATRLTGVLGISGFAGSGKSTVAHYLVERYGYSEASLADPIKRACKEIFGFTDDQLWGPSHCRAELDTRYPFSGLSPIDGSKLVETAKSDHEYWLDINRGHVYPKYLNARLALITLGTEFGRRLDQDIWIKSALNYISNSGKELWAIPDVRFNNEMSIIRSAGGILLRIKRAEQKSLHQSEEEMASIEDSSFHYVIDNTGTLDTLYSSVDSVVADFRHSTSE